MSTTTAPYPTGPRTRWKASASPSPRPATPAAAASSPRAGPSSSGAGSTSDNAAHAPTDDAALGRGPDGFLPAVLTKFEGTELFNYHPLIRAFEAENVSVVGADPANSVLDGGGDGWPLKAPKDAKKLRELGASNAPVDASVLRPKTIPFRCRRVSLANFSLVNAPFWAVHPVYSENAWVRNLRVNTPWDRPNTDGVDPEACKDVLVENCVISAGDDAVALKTGRDADGWRAASLPNIVVRRNVLASRFNGICVGSEVSGGVDNVFFLENRIERAFHAIFVKSNSERGSFVRYVHVAHVKAYDLAGDCIHFTNDYKGVRGARPTTFEKFAFKDVICRSAVFAIRATSLAASPIADVTIRDVIVKSTMRTTPDHPVSHPVAVANVANWEVANLRQRPPWTCRTGRRSRTGGAPS
ncbi:glycosyl hydrolase [Aureococcus anophagefferens]|nr:glycosyl hydrolase [Aureococcus anophagefferens]